MQTKANIQQDPVKIDNLMKQGKLGSLLQRVTQLNALNAALYDGLSAALRPHCQVVNLDFNVVVIGTQNSQVANTLYYQQNQILAKLQRALPNLNIQLIRVRVSPHF